MINKKLPHAKIAAKDNPEKLSQAKASYNKAIQIAKEILYQKLTLANEQYKQSITQNIPAKPIPTSPENKSETSQAKLVYSNTIKDAKYIPSEYDKIYSFGFVIAD